MASVAEKLLTAEEFAKLPNPPDGSRQELVRGVIVTMPPPKGKHGACCSKVDRRLGNFVEANKHGLRDGALSRYGSWAGYCLLELCSVAGNP